MLPYRRFINQFVKKMKRLSLLWLALTVAIGAAYAAPVDVNQAKHCGRQFVAHTLGQRSAELTLAYTGVGEAGATALYVFNYDQGFVVVAADDRAHPILGYNEGEAFDWESAPEGLRYYLNYYARQIQYAVDNNLPADLEMAEQWYWVEKEGVMGQTRGEKAVNPLLTTTWDQGWPYNYYAPACNSYWTNNHCYAGCVATAMSQVMKYWNWPETGVGEHSYTTSSYPGNGAALSANFGETTYEWAIMPNSVSSANAGGLAVALLMYHCGIAVNMDYSPNGSGAQTGDAVDAVIEHFRYGACTRLGYRDDYSRTEWEDELMHNLDRGFPMIYAGQDSDGGHAFNCDGYNAQRFFHFNWGWSGSYNNYFQIDALNTGNGSFNTYQRAILDMIPDYIYEALVPAIETMTVNVADAITKTAVLEWTVPTQSVTGADLETVQQVVLKRNGTVIQTYDNVQPGTTVTFEDQVADYGAYEYTILGKNHDVEGDAFSQIVVFGPNCTWKFVCQTTNFQGWNGGKIQVIGANGVVFEEIMMTTSSPLSEKFQMPEGAFSLNWVAPLNPVSSLSISLKNSANQAVYTFSGSSAQLNGNVFNGTNDCPNCTPPTGLTGEYHWEDSEFGTLLNWNCDYDPSKYKIYRSEDGVEYELIATIENTEHSYFDNVGAGDYYYKVTAFSSACESTPAQTDENTDFVHVTVTDVNESGIGVNVYPNPVNGLFYVQAANITEVTVYNVIGQSVYRFHGMTDRLEVNVSGLEPGVYTVDIVTGHGQVSRRIIVL